LKTLDIFPNQYLSLVINYFLMTASEKTWDACRSEILSLLDEIDAPSSEIHGTEWLPRILYGHRG